MSDDKGNEKSFDESLVKRDRSGKPIRPAPPLPSQTNKHLSGAYTKENEAYQAALAEWNRAQVQDDNASVSSLGSDDSLVQNEELSQEQRRVLGDIPTDLEVIVYQAIGDNPRRYEVDIPDFGKHEGYLSAEVDANNIEAVRNFVIADLRAQYPVEQNVETAEEKTERTKAATTIQRAVRTFQDRNHMDLTSLDMREKGKAKVFEGKMAKLGEAIAKIDPGVKRGYFAQTMHIGGLIAQRPFATRYSKIFEQNEEVQRYIKQALATDYKVVDFTDPDGKKTKTVKFIDLADHMLDHVAHLKSNPGWRSKGDDHVKFVNELEASALKYKDWVDMAKDPRSSTAKIVDRTISVARMATLVGAAVAFAEFGPVAQTIALGKAGVAGAAALGKGAASLGAAGVAGTVGAFNAGVAGGAGLIAAGVAGGALSILALTGYGAAAIAVIAVGVWLYKRNEAAVDKFFSDSKEVIGNTASAAWEGTKNFFRPAITAMGDAASWAKEMIKSKYQHEKLHHSMYKPNKEAELKLNGDELEALKEAIIKANVAVYASDPEGEAIAMNPLTLLDNKHPSEEDIKASGEKLRAGYGLHFDHESHSSSEKGVTYPALHGKGELDLDQANPRTLNGIVLLAEELRAAENQLEDLLIGVGESKESSLSQAEYDAIKPLLKSVRRQKALLDTSISVEKAKQSKEEWKAIMTSAKDTVFGVKLDEAKSRLVTAQEKLVTLKQDQRDVSAGQGYDFIAEEIVAADKLVEKLQIQLGKVQEKSDEMAARLEAEANEPSLLQSVKAYFSRDKAKAKAKMDGAFNGSGDKGFDTGSDTTASRDSSPDPSPAPSPTSSPKVNPDVRERQDSMKTSVHEIRRADVNEEEVKLEAQGAFEKQKEVVESMERVEGFDDKSPDYVEAFGLLEDAITYLNEVDPDYIQNMYPEQDGNRPS